MALRWLLTANAFVTFASLASSQRILPTSASSSFPSCGLSCAVLVAAQSTCDSTYASGTAQLTYENCFCTQASVQPLYASADGLCTSECTAESDRTLLQKWFTSFCKDVGEGINPQTVSSSSTTAASTTAATSTSTSSNAATTSSSSSTDSGTDEPISGSNTSSGSSWIKTHWRWILMLGILVVGLSLFALLVLWLKKRYQRKGLEQRISMSGFPSPTEKKDVPQAAAAADLWGPHQHMHATNGWQYQTEPASVVSDDRYSSTQQAKHQSKRDSSRTSRVLDHGSDARNSSSSRTRLRG